jgi:hypothetical protein
MRSRLVAVLMAGAALLGGSLAAATAATAGTTSPAKAPAAGKVAPSADSLPGVVSPTPVSYTPNISPGSCSSSVCNPSDVYATAVVNGEIVVAGAFESVCSPAKSTGYAVCPNNVTRYFIFAYNPQNGAIDPNFAPVLNTGPVYALAAGPNDTVYAGGKFTTVNGQPTPGIAALSVTPSDQATDGQLVPGFSGKATGTVQALAYNGNALYVSGEISKVDGHTAKVTRINATTGAYDKTFSFNVANPVEGNTLHIDHMSLTPNGQTLALAGTFSDINGQSDPRVALISTGGGLGTTATLVNWSAPDLANNCGKQHNYVNGIDFSPDGSFFVIADTGFDTTGGPALCDAAARFETSATGNKVQPTWIDYASGDTLHSVAVTGGAVYIGGHQRWMTNECGKNHVCEANAVLVNGLAALDANTGLTLPYWHPMTARGVGVMSLTPYPAGTFTGSDGGLIIGVNVGTIAGATHDELAQFPMTTAAQPTVGGPVQSGIWADGRPGVDEETNSGPPALCMDDTGNGSAPGTPVEAITCQNDNEQNWTEAAPGGTGEIQINGLCLDTSGSSAVVNACSGSSTQMWSQGTGNTLVNSAGSCLTDPGASTTSGTKLTATTCSPGSTSQSWPLPAAQAPPGPPPTGPVYSYQERGSDVPCLTDQNASTTTGNPVVMNNCFGFASESWIAESNNSIQFNTGSGSYCLDTSGSNVVLNPCNSGSTQGWQPQSNRELKNIASGLCLTDPGSNNTQLQVSSCSATASKEWRLPTY